MVRGAAALGISYAAMRDLVLRRKVVGGQDPRTRHWWVSSADLRRFQREQGESDMGTAATAPGRLLGEELDRTLKRRVIDREVGAATAPEPSFEENPVAFLLARVPKERYAEIARHLFADPEGRAAIEAALRDSKPGR